MPRTAYRIITTASGGYITAQPIGRLRREHAQRMLQVALHRQIGALDDARQWLMAAAHTRTLLDIASD